jgi:hypothetical protein
MELTQVQDAIDLIRMEYAEMPELHLTFLQAQRLWNLSTELCKRALTALIGSGVVVCTCEGAYVRRGDGLVSDNALNRSPMPCGRVWDHGAAT